MIDRSMIERVARFELIAAIVVALAIASTGPGCRFGWWPVTRAFLLMRYAAWIALAIALAAIVTWWWSRSSRSPRGGGETTKPAAWAPPVAIAISIAAAAFPLGLAWNASRVPPIHDITTDVADPPAFVAVAPLRANARNPVTYEGERVASQQRAAYPDMLPFETAAAPAATFNRALAAARSMGWTIVDANAADGRIEASDTTPFFGFVDDVVIRVKPAATGARVDVRSKSRIGVSDIGANARRIRRYLDALRSG